MDNEVTPPLAPVPGVDLEDDKRSLRHRFDNSAINDQLGRIATDGSSRLAEFVLPTILGQLAVDGPIRLGCLAVAAWFRCLAGLDLAPDADRERATR